MIHRLFSNLLNFSRVPSTRNEANSLILMPLTQRLFHGLPLNLNKLMPHCGSGEAWNENGGHMGLRFGISRGALPPSSLNDDLHRLGCGIVVDHSDHIEPFSNAGQVQGLVPRP